MAKPAGQHVVRIDGRIVSLAQALQTFTYDLDGNLTQDGIWTYTWDAEGRLVAMATTPTAVAAGFVEQTLRFVYDHLGRRVRKEVFGEGSALVSRTIWIYDAWNMIAEYDQPAIGGALTLKRSYAWGLDLLGDLRASGGVGALLQLRDYSENATYLAGYDGNGNLTTLQNAATGTLAAAYEYGPYGEPIATSGAYADKNPVRFSTKYTDDETGLVYYGRRYYDPRNGRFLGRDPIEEEGGLNLYGFVGNDPSNRGDRLGLSPVSIAEDGGHSRVTDHLVGALESMYQQHSMIAWRWSQFGMRTRLPVGAVTATGQVSGVPTSRYPGNATLTISDEGLALIAELEGFRGGIYMDQAGIPTIGFGHKLLPGEERKYANGITREQALELLRADVGRAAASIRRNVGVQLEQAEFDSLVSFVYNVGTGAFAESTLLKKLNTGDKISVPAEMARWNKITVGGQKVESDGLSNRRWREGWVWHGIYDPAAEGIARPGG
jgi:RHS repeat-associated protein